jgi:nitroreductase / dihydropteridine reductase
MDKQIIDALNWRYATKKFDSSKKIDEKTLDLLIETLRLSPSSFGLQAWKFLIVENKEVREKLQPASWNQPQITDASHLIIFCRRTDLNEKTVEEYVKSTAEIRNVKEEDLDGMKKMLMGFITSQTTDFLQEWTAKQLYVALGVLLTSASLLKVDACPMEGFDKIQVDEILGLREKKLASVLICPVGYRAEDDKYATLAKSRFAKKDVVEKI